MELKHNSITSGMINQDDYFIENEDEMMKELTQSFGKIESSNEYKEKLEKELESLILEVENNEYSNYRF